MTAFVLLLVKLALMALAILSGGLWGMSVAEKGEAAAGGFFLAACVLGLLTVITGLVA